MTTGHGGPPKRIAPAGTAIATGANQFESRGAYNRIHTTALSVRAIAKALGGDVVNASSVLVPGPGHSKSDRSLHVTLHRDGGFSCHSYSGDDWRTCRDHVTAIIGGGVPPVFHAKEARLPADGITAGLRIWSETEESHPILKAYLDSRGLEGLEPPAHALRFHPACPWGKGIVVPAMIGLLRDLHTNEPCGIHRTALKPDGSGKAEFPDGTPTKKMLGRAKGAAIKLTRDEDVHEGLAIVEGVETGLSALSAGVQPVWALGSAGAIADFPVLAGIECLAIFCDFDDVGLTAARSCGARWVEARRPVIVARPQHIKTDWNDVVRESRS